MHPIFNLKQDNLVFILKIVSREQIKPSTDSMRLIFYKGPSDCRGEAELEETPSQGKTLSWNCGTQSQMWRLQRHLDVGPGAFKQKSCPLYPQKILYTLRLKMTTELQDAQK